MADFRELLREFQKLNLPDGQYAIYGSGPLAARGLREARDLDVIVLDGLYQKLKEQYPKDPRKERIKIGEIEIYPSWTWKDKQGDLERVIRRAEVIKGLRFIRLDDLLGCKQRMGRQKDFDDIELIKSYLKQKSGNLIN